VIDLSKVIHGASLPTLWILEEIKAKIYLFQRGKE
jgi:hypothetical protein